MSQYSLGTVSVTQNSATVVGVGTGWTSALTVGQLFAVASQLVWYTIKSIESDTHLTLTGNYVGPTLATQKYVVQRDYTPNNSYPIPSYGDTGSASLIALTLLQLDSQLAALSIATQTIQGNVVIDGQLTITGTSLGYSGVFITNSGISGGTLDGAPIGATTPSSAVVTTLRAEVSAEFGSSNAWEGWNLYLSTGGAWTYRTTDFGYAWRHNGSSLALYAAVSGTAGATATLNPAISVAGATGVVSFPNGVLVPADWQKNRITNGGFDIWQNGTNFIVSTGTSSYYADQWIVWNTLGVSATIQKITGLSSPSGIGMTATAVPANGLIQLGTRFEGGALADLAGQSCTLSFDINASATAGTLTGNVGFAVNSGLDNSTFSTVNPTVAFTIPTGAQRVSITLPAAAVANLQLGSQLAWTFQLTGATGNISINIGAVQLEKGPVANPWAPKGIARELEDCRRYFQTSWPVNLTSPYTASPAWIYSPATTVGNGGIFGSTVLYPTQMRVSPTVTFFDPIGTSGAVQVNGVNGQSAYASGGSRALFNGFVNNSGSVDRRRVEHSHALDCERAPMSTSYAFTASGGLVRQPDGSLIPIDGGNSDYQSYLVWASLGNVATAYVAPAPVFTCLLWQLQAVLTVDQFAGIQAEIATLNDPTVSAFFAHGTNLIPSNSTTLLSIAAGIGLTSDQVAAIVQTASAISIP